MEDEKVIDKWKLTLNTVGDPAACNLELNGKQILASKASVIVDNIDGKGIIPVLNITIPIVNNNLDIVIDNKPATDIEVHNINMEV